MDNQEMKFISLLEKYKVVIPPIQRDYAQGRDNNDIKRIRSSFLTNISNALSDNNTSSLKLDFIYGYSTQYEIENATHLAIFKPLDGQQRLTTLFLLHWYAAVYDNQMTDMNRSLLSNFSYATRKKCRSFCEKLICFTPSIESESQSIGSQIENQSWFFLSWKSDPTISSMLVMLDAIENEFKKNQFKGAWEKLVGESPRIIFYLLSMDDLGLPEDLYIKMNSRGKALTNFEHFKSQFSRIISYDMKAQFNKKIDNQWSDLFWSIHMNDDIKDVAAAVDSSFLNFYNYITDLLIIIKEIPIPDNYWLEVANKVYGDNLDNVHFLFKCLDTFVEQQKNTPDFFYQFLYIDKEDFSKDKVRLFFNNSTINLFHKSARLYDNSARSNPFSIGEQLMLYAFIYNLQNKIYSFSKKIRVIRNLIASSEDQIRKENLKALYSEIENILNSIPIDNTLVFSKHQVSEESTKSTFINKHKDLEETLYNLEDHRLLRGSISVIALSLDIESYANTFNLVFDENLQSNDSKSNYVLISRAMMTIGNYSQAYGGGKRRFGYSNDSWRDLFTKFDKRLDSDKTHTILKKYLKVFIESPQIDNKEIIESYHPEFYSWEYYFSKYDSFHNYKKGFFYWHDYEGKPYQCYMMNQETFRGQSWDPFLYELSIKHKTLCTLEGYGNDLQFSCSGYIFNIKMLNDHIKFSTPKEDSVSNPELSRIIEYGILDENASIVVPQDTEGYDLNDRIRLCSNALLEIESFLIHS